MRGRNLLRLLLANVPYGLTVDKARAATALWVAGVAGGLRYAVVALIHPETGGQLVRDDLVGTRLRWEHENSKRRTRSDLLDELIGFPGSRRRDDMVDAFRFAVTAWDKVVKP